MKSLFSIILIFIGASMQAQTIHGKVTTDTNEPIVGASVVILGTTKGSLTDFNGHFTLDLENEDHQVVVSYVGYLPDTINIQEKGNASIHIILKSKELTEVVVRGSSTFVDALQPIHTTVITEQELTKAACCNLSESFETNASVDVSFSDAVTGAKQIQMLGLDGIYVQINRENIPNIRGINARYGLGFVPGTWIQSIDVGKGAGSVISGFESMTGQINVELKKPENMERLFLNGYVNESGRSELNFHGSHQFTDKISSGLFIHGNYFGSDMDRNEDNFVDIPKSRQFNVLNRWKYAGDRLMSQAGVHILVEDKAGGQMNFSWDDDASIAADQGRYGYNSIIRRTEVFGKTALLYPEKPYKGLGFIYSGSYQEMDAAYGRKEYSGKERSLYTNLIYQSIIDNSFHQFKTGASFLYDDYDEQYNDSTFARTEKVPGVFIEYSYMPMDKFTAVFGIRNDFHNLYGNMFTPRFHFRYNLIKDATIRLSAGKGFRVPNVIAENTGVLVSARDIVVVEELKPEESWNFGTTITYDLEFFGKTTNVSLDYFYTDFQNQLVVDLDKDASKVYFSNLKGDSYAHSFQAEAAINLSERFNSKLAYKFYDVKTTLNGRVQNVPFISKHRLFAKLGYSTLYDIWQFDLTGQWYGAKRLPNTANNPLEYQLDEYSPNYFTFNGQMSRAFRWGELYLGVENILNFRQEDPIISAEDPFGSHFDASMSWGPLAGRMVYAGFRYRIEN